MEDTVPDQAEETRPFKRRRHHGKEPEDCSWLPRQDETDEINSTVNIYRFSAHLLRCASKLIHSTISDDLRQLMTDGIGVDGILDSILDCGGGPLGILMCRPEKVLQLSKDKTYQWSFKDVPRCWLRLCEDASLLVASKLLATSARELDDMKAETKEAEVDGSPRLTEKMSDMISAVVKTFDLGTSLSGLPKRRVLVNSCFDLLDQCLVGESFPGYPPTFPMQIPPLLNSSHTMCRSRPLSFDSFQIHLDGGNAPLVMTGVIDEWPALELWQSPGYLLKSTAGGRRLALVEIGASYAHQSMQQSLMPVKDFLQTYILNVETKEIGYIAQHDLLGHVRSLSKDVMTPEYCYSSPPQACSTPADTGAAPRRNVWIGPRGTRSPFHTDPDANLYCQVVGYKYFRLISTKQSDKMYARGREEQGLDLSNQSQVIDFSFAQRNDHTSTEARYPLFAEADFQEVILRPGDCLYIPSRCWHFAESLSTSIGVNFWWT